MSTTVIFKLEHQLPNLLADVSVKAFGVETSCRVIFGENLQQFRRIAEAMASGVAVDAQAEAEDGDMTVGIELLMEDMNGDDVAEDGSEVETLKEDDGLLEEDIHLQDEGEEEGLEEGDEEEEEEEAPTPVIKTGKPEDIEGLFSDIMRLLCLYCLQMFLFLYDHFSTLMLHLTVICIQLPSGGAADPRKLNPMARRALWLPRASAREEPLARQRWQSHPRRDRYGPGGRGREEHSRAKGLRIEADTKTPVIVPRF